MQRRALAQAAATVAVLAVALAGCTGSDETSGAVDSQSGGAGASSVPAPSGKYSTLPEPCTALSTGALEELLPGTEEQSEEEAEETLAGEPDLTYDADRLVGCSWERETTEGGHQLELRFERIVSYDDEVSDDEQAAQIYTERAQEHDVDVTSAPPDLPDKGDAPATGEGSAPADGDDAEAGGETDDGTNDDSTDDGTDTGTDIGTDAGADDSADSSESPDDDPAATIAPRLLDDIGDESFLDDRTAGAGAGVQREVTVVFRTSNVVVTVTYDQWHTAGSEPPDSAELQQRAQQVADQLADQLAG